MTEPTPTVAQESDATPLVRLLTRTIRLSLRQRPSLLSVSPGGGIVVIKSAADSQVASVEITSEAVYVVRGARPDAQAVLTVDLSRRLEVTAAEADEQDDLVALASMLLQPALPLWSEAAHDFWNLVGADTGMPSTLVVQNSDRDGDVLELGRGLPRYVLQGSADSLAGVFTGADSFLDEVYAGNLKVRGTLPQLSVMAGASFKVRFHV